MTNVNAYLDETFKKINIEVFQRGYRTNFEQPYVGGC